MTAEWIIAAVLAVLNLGGIASTAVKRRRLRSGIPRCECGHPRYSHINRQGTCKSMWCNCDGYAEHPEMRERAKIPRAEVRR